LHAQGIKIQSVRANVGEILVDYTLDNPKTAHQIKLQLDYEGQTWTPNSVFGDAGQNITGPTPKTLRWDAGKEGKEINGPVTVRLLTNSFAGVQTPKHLLRSLLFPGAGQYQLRNKAHYFLHGLGAYAALGGGIYFQHLAQNSYANYLTSSSIDESNRLFSNANQEQWVSLSLLGTAAAIWIVDMATVAARTRKLNKAWRTQGINPTLSKYYSQKSTDFREYVKPTFADTRSRSSVLVAQGMDWFNKGEFETALRHFDEALTYEPNMRQASNWKSETETKLQKIKSLEKEYENLLDEGRDFFSEAEKVWNAQTGSPQVIKSLLEASKTKLNAAAKVIFNQPTLEKQKTEHKIILNKIEILDAKILQAIQIDQMLVRGDSLHRLGKSNFNESLLRQALTEYQSVLKLDPSNFKANPKISEIKIQLLQIEMAEIEKLISKEELYLAEIKIDRLIDVESPPAEVQRRADFISKTKSKLERIRIEADYKEKIRLADEALKNKEYQLARKNYLEALQLKPADSYAQGQVSKLDKILADEDLFPTSKWTAFDLYEDNLIRIKYSGKKGTLSCLNQQGTPFLFRYSIEFLGSESLSTTTRKNRIKQFLIYTVDYKDCNNVTYACTEFVDLHKIIDESTDNLVNMDFNYPTDKIISKPYKIILSDIKIRKCVPK
jgi:hypothetical protein